MQLDCQDFGDTRVITVNEPRLDAALAIQFKDMFREMAGTQMPRIVLDLSQVGFLDSSGLGAVVAAMKLLGSERRLELAGLTPTVEKVFRLTRMDMVFTVHADVQAALGELRDAS